MRILRPPFRYVHIGWAVLVLAACVALVLMGGGHPPPMIFVPVVLAAGVLGHLLLLLAAWLADRGGARAVIGGATAPAWPPEVGVVALLLAGLAIASIAITIGEWPRLRTEPLVWLLLAAIAAAHAAAFFVLMLRHRAARWLVAVVAAGWATALLLQFHETRGPGEVVLAIAIVAALFAVAGWGLRSRRLSAFLH